MLNIEPRVRVVEEARAWVGTAYGHQGRMQGSKVDCVGLIIAVGLATGVLEITADQWRPYAGYSRTPNPRRMGEAMAEFLIPLELAARPDALPPDGTVAWLQWREDLPMHLGILATFEGRRTLIHAFEHVGKCVEHGFAAEWPNRVASWWCYPGLAEA